MASDTKNLLGAARRAGATVERRGRHWLVKGPEGTTTISHSPSDKRAFANARARLRKIGVKVP